MLQKFIDDTDDKALLKKLHNAAYEEVGKDLNYNVVKQSNSKMHLHEK